MNTPKLLSIISSTTGHVDPARNGRATDPVHGLDFSRLLGERRSQAAAAPVVTQRPAQDNVRRSTPEQSRTDNAPARSDTQRDTAAAPAAGTTPSPASGSRPAAENNARPDNQAPQENNTQAPSTPADNTANAATPPAENGAQSDAQLAQNAAEAGLSAIVAAPAATLGVAVAAVAAGQPAQAAPQPGAAALPGAPAAAALLEDIDIELQVDPKAVNTPRPAAGQQAAAAAMPVPAALAQAVSALQVAPAANPATAPAANPAILPVAAHPVADVLPVTVATDTTSSAAALSLQEFTAMVAAARATSGTVLAPSTFATQTALPATSALMPGVLPAGLIPGQAFATATPLAGSIAAPLASPQWSTEFGRQFINIAQAGKGLGQVAELRLDPPDLGPLRITINLSDNVAHAVFSSPHALVRQTVENALPQLQQMLEQAGISLGQANVNDEHQSGQASQQGGNGNLQAGLAGAGSSDDPADAQSDRSRPADPSALVDTFA